MSIAAVRGDAVRPLAGMLVGLIVGVGVALSRETTPKHFLPAIAGLLFVLIVAVWKHGEQFCLFAFLLSAPLPMHAFVIKLDPLHGGGALGLYAVASDAPFLGLIAFWFFDWARGCGPQKRSVKQLLLLVPFLLIGFISTAYAQKPLWAFCEWIRWVKFAAVLFYMICRLRTRDIPVVLSGLSTSVLFEGGIAALQAAFRSNLSLDKLGLFGTGGGSSLTQEVAGGLLFRGSALSGHPNYLASYLLLVLPIVGCLSLSDSRKRRCLWWSLTFLVGTTGLAATMSRAAIASFAAACFLGMAAAIIYRLTFPRRVFLIIGIWVFAMGSLGLYYYDAIQERLRGDWDNSWELRSHLNNSAIAMAQEHFLVGVGMNNYTVAYPSYNPEFAATLLEVDDMITAVHNLYLLVWAELGSLGLASFFLFLFGNILVVVRSLPKLDVQGRSVMIGFVCGLLAAMANDLTEFALWVDLNMFTLAVTAGMLPVLQERSRQGRIRPA